MATLPKKRAVYVRGANNVYRRRTEPAMSVYSADSVDLKNKEEMDRLLDELGECGFQVPETTKLPDPAVHQQSAKPVVSPTGHRRPLPASAMPETAEPEYGDMSPNPVFSRFSLRWSRDRILEKLAPFFLGMFTTYALQLSLPYLSYYFTVAVGVMKIAIIWGAATGLICWYAGLIKVSTFSNLQNYATRTWLSLNGSPVEQEIAVDAEEPTENPVRVDPEPVLETVPKTVYEEKAVAPPPISTRVTPFAPQVRQTPSPTEPLRLGRKPVLIRGNTEQEHRKPRVRGLPVRVEPSLGPRRHSSASVDPVYDKHYKGAYKDAYKDKTYAGYKEMPKEVYKPLPPVKAPAYEEDLPMAYEVKLKSIYDDEPLRGYGQETHRTLERLGTMMSQKSVLGTRKNYNKFLANVNT